MLADALSHIKGDAVPYGCLTSDAHGRSAKSTVLATDGWNHRRAQAGSEGGREGGCLFLGVVALPSAFVCDSKLPKPSMICRLLSKKLKRRRRSDVWSRRKW